MGSTRVLTDQNGNNLAQCNQNSYYAQGSLLTYAPFGGELDCTQSQTTYKFTGKERDAESGNDYFGARYYGSSMGRMLSPDPVGGSLANPQTLNKYAYVLNNPLTFTDPTGLYACGDDAAGATKHCTSAADVQFEKSRQHDLQSKNADVRRAAAAYGDPGKLVVDARGDKVTVQFKDLGSSGEGGVTQSLLDANGTTPISNSTVTINSGSSGTALDADVGHEGSHVADAQDMAASIHDITTSGFKVGDNISQYASEQRAYRVTDSIYRSAHETYHGCASDACALGAGSSPIGIQGRIDAILRANPNIYHGPDGKPLTPQNPGGNVLNIVVPQ